MIQATEGGELGSDNQNNSSSSRVENFNSTLGPFGEERQCKLGVSPERESSKPDLALQLLDNISLEDRPKSIKHKAAIWFLKGTEHEKNRNLYKALQFYKRAVQLVPDIEFRLCESYKPNSQEKLDPHKGIEVRVEELDADLLTKITQIVCRNESVCSSQFDQNTTHISALPMKIILNILKWVVSSELDLRSLEMVSEVCRGFFVSARNSEIWRLACVRAWGVKCGALDSQYLSWRQMYLERPRLHYNGCYISRASYLRQGDNSSQDRFSTTWGVVEYLRLLRFFPEGRVLMLTSTANAQTCVNSLKQRRPGNPSALIGHHRIYDNRVAMLFEIKKIHRTNKHRQKTEVQVYDCGQQTFYLELEIQNIQEMANCRLVWKTFDIFNKYQNGQETKASLNLSRVSFPSLKFSRVRSYTTESQASLQ